jgi:hypothetical protein
MHVTRSLFVILIILKTKVAKSVKLLHDIEVTTWPGASNKDLAPSNYRRIEPKCTCPRSQFGFVGGNIAVHFVELAGIIAKVVETIHYGYAAIHCAIRIESRGNATVRVV